MPKNTTLSDHVTPLVHRQVEKEEEEELIQTKAFDVTNNAALQGQPEEEQLLKNKEIPGQAPVVTPHRNFRDVLNF